MEKLTTEKCRSCDPAEVGDSRTSRGKAAIAAHPDHSASKRRVNRIKGQVEAVSRMMDERAYCPDIIQQIRAAASALRGLESEILRGHFRGCVKKAFESKNTFEVNNKIEEILGLLNR